MKLVRLLGLAIRYLVGVVLRSLMLTVSLLANVLRNSAKDIIKSLFSSK